MFVPLNATPPTVTTDAAFNQQKVVVMDGVKNCLRVNNFGSLASGVNKPFSIILAMRADDPNANDRAIWSFTEAATPHHLQLEHRGRGLHGRSRHARVEDLSVLRREHGHPGSQLRCI